MSCYCCFLRSKAELDQEAIISGNLATETNLIVLDLLEMIVQVTENSYSALNKYLDILALNNDFDLCSSSRRFLWQTVRIMWSVEC